MQINPVRETWGAGNRKWLGSRHGVTNAQTVTIDGTKIKNLTKLTGGILPSGLPLKRGADGKFEPVTAPTDVLAGFLLVDQSVKQPDVDVIVPMLDHGRIRTAYLPTQGFDIETLTTGTPSFIIIPKGVK